MLLTEAISLIASTRIKSDQPQIWADFGAGDGLFSFALADLLCPGSTIYAVDKTDVKLRSEKTNCTAVIQVIADFEKHDLSIPLLNGFIAANALHFIADQKTCIKRLVQLCKPSAHFIIVEYDTLSAGRWIPFPLPFSVLRKIVEQTTTGKIHRLGNMKSKYNSSDIYAAIVSI